MKILKLLLLSTAIISSGPALSVLGVTGEAQASSYTPTRVDELAGIDAGGRTFTLPPGARFSSDGLGGWTLSIPAPRGGSGDPARSDPSTTPLPFQTPDAASRPTHHDVPRPAYEPSQPPHPFCPPPPALPLHTIPAAVGPMTSAAALVPMAEAVLDTVSSSASGSSSSSSDSSHSTVSVLSPRVVDFAAGPTRPPVCSAGGPAIPVSASTSAVPEAQLARPVAPAGGYAGVTGPGSGSGAPAIHQHFNITVSSSGRGDGSGDGRSAGGGGGMSMAPSAAVSGGGDSDGPPPVITSGGGGSGDSGALSYAPPPTAYNPPPSYAPPPQPSSERVSPAACGGRGGGSRRWDYKAGGDDRAGDDRAGAAEAYPVATTVTPPRQVSPTVGSGGGFGQSGGMSGGRGGGSTRPSLSSSPTHHQQSSGGGGRGSGSTSPTLAGSGGGGRGGGSSRGHTPPLAVAAYSAPAATTPFGGGVPAYTPPPPSQSHGGGGGPVLLMLGHSSSPEAANVAMLAAGVAASLAHQHQSGGGGGGGGGHHTPSPTFGAHPPSPTFGGGGVVDLIPLTAAQLHAQPRSVQMIPLGMAFSHTYGAWYSRNRDGFLCVSAAEPRRSDVTRVPMNRNDAPRRTIVVYVPGPTPMECVDWTVEYCNTRTPPNTDSSTHAQVTGTGIRFVGNAVASRNLDRIFVSDASTRAANLTTVMSVMTFHQRCQRFRYNVSVMLQHGILRAGSQVTDPVRGDMLELGENTNVRLAPLTTRTRDGSGGLVSIPPIPNVLCAYTDRDENGWVSAEGIEWFKVAMLADPRFKSQ